jgi:N-ethylmaleimide reductase
MQQSHKHIKDALFSPIALGALQLPHRVIMAPMTRLRADDELAPQPWVRTYYAQRASAALIISESIMVAPHGEGYGPLPGIYSNAQRASWRKVVDAVHAQNGLIVAQLATLGRARYAPKAGARSANWAIAAPLRPHEFATSEVEALVEQFAEAAAAAREVGFDGVELHNGNGYLLDQFLRPGANLRDDRYGGPLDNRLRLALELVAAFRSAWPSDRIGVRLSPSALAAGKPDDHGIETFSHLLHALEREELAYVHVTRPTLADRERTGVSETVELAILRAAYRGSLIVAGDYDRDSAARAIAQGLADAVAFARLFVANPDLPERFRSGARLAALDDSTLYSGGDRGYVDYPAYSHN